MPVADRPTSTVPPQLLLQDNAVTSSYAHLSLEGLPEGKNPAKVIRCIQLLEHVVRCVFEPGKCPEGDGCRRTKQVLAHYFACSNMKRVKKDECDICRQLFVLFRNHSYHCQAGEGNCAVPNCKNKKLKAVPKPNTSKSNLVQYPANPTRGECQFVIRKLSEAMDFPTKQQKLQGIKCLLETNRQATILVLRYIFGKKENPQPVPQNHKMENVTVGQRIKPIVRLRREIHSLIRPRATRTCILKVIVSKAPLGA